MEGVRLKIIKEYIRLAKLQIACTKLPFDKGETRYKTLYHFFLGLGWSNPIYLIEHIPVFILRERRVKDGMWFQCYALGWV